MRGPHLPRRNALSQLAAILVIAFLAPPVAATGAAFPRPEQTAPPRPPAQPATGPGGAEAAYDAVAVERLGGLPTGVWVFSPADPVDVGDPAASGPWSLVVFFHGFTAVDPEVYRAWIDHVVRRGAVVVYPDYQTLDLLELDPRTYLPDAVAGIRAALDRFAAPDGPAVDLDRVGVVGHSAGGVLAVNYAALAPGLRLPVPDAVMPVEAGGCVGCGFSGGTGLPLADLAAVDPTTRFVALVGEEDDVVGDVASRVFWQRLTQIPSDQRAYVVLRSDDHGEPALVADHFLASTGGFRGEVDALDWYGTWRRFDALLACAFAADLCGVAFGEDSDATAMGEWSDGTAVRPTLVVADPAPAP